MSTSLSNAFKDNLILREKSIVETDIKYRTISNVPILADLTNANEIKEIDGFIFSQLCVAGYLNLLSKKAHLNKINVFPIADGDTGTNMVICMKRPVRNLLQEPADSIVKAAQNMAADVLLYGQGNSGTILSHFFISIAEHLQNEQNNIDTKISISDFASKILPKVGENMKNAVSDPVEGTMVSVAREATSSEKLKTCTTLLNLMETWSEICDAEVLKTPEQLIQNGEKVLEKAGVVDSGAQGFVYIIEGMKLACQGKLKNMDDSASFSTTEINVGEANSVETNVDHTVTDTKFRFCMEAVVHLKDGVTAEEAIEAFTKFQDGDSLATVKAPSKKGGQLVKAHIHTNDCQKFFDLAQTFSSMPILLKEKVEDMYEERKETHENDTSIYDLSNAKFRVVHHGGLPLREKKYATILPIFVIPSSTGEPMPNNIPQAYPITVSEMANKQRHKETAEVIGTAAPTPGQAQVVFSKTLAQFTDQKILSMTIPRLASACIRNVQQGRDNLPKEEQDKVVVYDTGVSAGIGPNTIVVREAIRASAAGLNIEEAVKRLDNMNPYMHSIMIVGAGGARRLEQWRPEIIKPIFQRAGVEEIKDGQYFAFGSNPPNPIPKKMKLAMGLALQKPIATSEEEAVASYISKIEEGMGENEVLRDVAVICMGRVDVAVKIYDEIKSRCKIGNENESICHEGDMARCLVHWGSIFISYWVDDGTRGCDYQAPPSSS